MNTNSVKCTIQYSTFDNFPFHTFLPQKKLAVREFVTALSTGNNTIALKIVSIHIIGTVEGQQWTGQKRCCRNKSPREYNSALRSFIW